MSAAVAGRLFDRLVGAERLTATASTFARPEVLVALARTVLVIDEAGMVGSRKLAGLLEHAQQA